MKKYICLGFNVDKERGIVNGMAMMHDLFIAILKDNGIRVRSISLNTHLKSIGVVGKPGKLRYLEYFSIVFSVLWAFISNRNVVFYFNPSTAKAGFYRDVLLVFMAKIFGHKVLMQQFGAMFETFKNGLRPFERKLLSWSYNKADTIIVEGEYAKRPYSFLNNQTKLIGIQNGLPELNKNVKKGSKTYDPQTPFMLFFMNNMIESKGYMDVLKAIDILVNEHKQNVYCVFAGRFMSLGENELFNNIEEAKEWFDDYIEQKKLSSRVVYYNSVFDEKKNAIFNKAHAFLLPSYYAFEGQPTSILEAISYGCVPIVTHYRLIPEIVNDSCGIFVESQSPDSIVEAVERLMANPDEYHRLSVNGFNRFNEKFTQKAYANKIMDVVRKL